MAVPAYLLGAEFCATAYPTADCDHAVKRNPETGRWFITMGHPGFNSPANNRTGYATERAAWAATRRYARR